MFFKLIVEIKMCFILFNFILISEDKKINSLLLSKIMIGDRLNNFTVYQNHKKPNISIDQTKSIKIL